MTCEFCGWCDGHCPWRIRCPECGAPPGIGVGQCVQGNRFVKLHDARWEAVGG